LRFKYAVILVLFIAIALIISHLMLPIDMQLRVMQRHTIGTVFSMQLLHYLLGALLGIEHLIDQFKKRGRFKFDLERFLIVGIPAFISIKGWQTESEDNNGESDDEDKGGS